MPYGSIGAAFGDGFESAMLERRKRQAEDIMQAMTLRTAESQLADAKHDREMAKENAKWVNEERKAVTEDRKERVLAARRTAALKKVPMKGMPWAPELEKEFIELDLNPEQYRTKGKPAQALQFGTSEVLPTQTPMAPPVAPLAMGAPLGLGTEVAPPEVIPAQAGTPDVSLGSLSQQRNESIAAALEALPQTASRRDMARAVLLGGGEFEEAEALGPAYAVTGPLGEFRARQAMSPEERAEFDAWDKAQANLKNPTIKNPTITVNNQPNAETGFTPGEAKMFGTIRSEYDRSPAKQATDRARTLEAQAQHLLLNPTSPSDQVATAYSFIGGIDNYQSAVRGEELENLNLLSTDVAKLKTRVDRIAKTGAFLPSELATELANASKRLVNILKQNNIATKKEFASKAKTMGVGKLWEANEAEIGAEDSVSSSKRIRYDTNGNVLTN